MGIIEITENVFLFLAGIGAFITGLNIMSDRLESSFSSSLRNLFDKVGKSRFKGIGIGIGVTTLTQSSSATTVITVGFANAGILSLQQATAIIMGANIGTTLTIQIIALKGALGWINGLLCSSCFIGAMLMLTGGDKSKKIGSLLSSIGLIFTGLYVMDVGAEFFQSLTLVRELFARINSPYIMFLAGLLVTMIIQSSAATTGMLLGFIGAGLMDVNPALFAIIGANIGTCITALLASLSTSIYGKRVAVIHLLFNVIGAVIFIIVMTAFPLHEWLDLLFPNMEFQQIATFHTIFNTVTTILLCPFIEELTNFVEKTVCKRYSDKNGPRPNKEVNYDTRKKT